MIYFCCDEHRRNAVKNHETLNGIEFIEVLDKPTDPYEQRQNTLFVHFIKNLTPGELSKENVIIEGGERIQNIKVIDVSYGEASSPPLISPPGVKANVIVVKVASPGDFSTYTLRLIQDIKHKKPPVGFDPILSAVDFSFKIACPSDFDCKSQRICPTEPVKLPEINYLAKDYASFRQFMLDRLSLLMPQWKERNPADIGISLVELLAYVGDHLSYQQDAVATEAYLSTARQRVSVRRHARLIDYFMHDGCNSRVWVQIRVKPEVKNLKLKKGSGKNTTKLLTCISDQSTVISHNFLKNEKATNEDLQVFELMHDITLFGKHNEMKFYTWSARECYLPKGATQATLKGSFPALKPGHVLILTEVRDPQTGKSEDADPLHRHAVRLTEVKLDYDPIGSQSLSSPPTGSPPKTASIPVTEIIWHKEDALPFPLCISARRGTAYYEDISVALGNIILADHGQTIQDDSKNRSLEPFIVPKPNPALTKAPTYKIGHCEKRSVEITPPRFRPKLKQASLTHAVPYNLDKPPVSAHTAMQWSMRTPQPAITLNIHNEAGTWKPKRDLLNSSSDAKEFVVEMDTDGTAFIRFGDNKHGARPTSGSKFLAVYRIGNGVSGNIGAETIAHILSYDTKISTNDPEIVNVWNPLPAQGGIEPESSEQVKQNAPSALFKQERAVTPEDYSEIAQRCSSDIQRAEASYRWTGSWHTVFLTVDRLYGEKVNENYKKNMRMCLEKYRMAGHDLEVDSPRYVPLEIEMLVCVKPDYFASNVKAALLEVFSNKTLPDGRKGVFHPDNFTFGETVYLSPLYSAAQATAGVASVKITKFQRQGTPSEEAIDSGKLHLERLEVARLDNDPNFPENGVLNLILEGGR